MPRIETGPFSSVQIDSDDRISIVRGQVASPSNRGIYQNTGSIYLRLDLTEQEVDALRTLLKLQPCREHQPCIDPE